MGRSIFISIVFFASAASAAPTLTLQGRILKPDGSPLNESSTQFRVRVMSPQSDRCILYDETQTLDLQGADGLFTFTLNSGAGTRNDTSNAHGFAAAFSNLKDFSVDGSLCAAGSGTVTYTPSADDERKVIVYFKSPSMSTWEQMPETRFTSTAFALQAREVGGFGAEALCRVADASGPQSVAPLTPADFTELQALLAGNSTKYTKTSSGAAGLPLLSANPGTLSKGQIWYDSGSNTIKFYNGSVQTVGASGAGLSSVTVGSGLTADGTEAGTLSAPGTIALKDTGVSANTYGSATQIPVFAVNAQGRITSVTNTSISGAAPTGSAGGDLDGSYPNPTIKDGAVTTSKMFSPLATVNRLVSVSGVTGETVAPFTCAIGQTLKWDVTNGWVCSTDWQNATAGVLYTTAGNVGIGTSNPAALLDVQGDVNFKGLLKYDGVPVFFHDQTLNNNFVGRNLPTGVTGTLNAGYGYSALTAMTTGANNTGVGAYAIAANVDGSGNTALGNRVLQMHTTGSNNTALGYYSMRQGAGGGSNNTAVGASSLRYVIGDNNIAVGYGAADGLTTGNNNIVIGVSQQVTDGLDNQLNIGGILKGNLGTGDMGTTGKWGVGTLSPAHALDVVGDGIYLNGANILSQAANNTVTYSAGNYAFSYNTTMASNLTRYMGAANTAGASSDVAAYVVPRAGFVDKLYVAADANTLTAATTQVTLFKNGAATALTTTLAAGAVAGNDTTNTVSVAPGDSISMQIVTSNAGSGTVSRPRASVNFNTTTNVFGSQWTSSGSNIGFTGSVGIGTGTPSAPLHVRGSGAYPALAESSGSSAGLEFKNSGSSGGAEGISASGNSLNLQTDGTTRLTVLNTGEVGIGTTSPARKLELRQTDSDNALLRLTSVPSVAGTSYESALEFYTSTTTAVSPLLSGRISSNFTGTSYTNTVLKLQNATTGGVLVDTMVLNNGKVGVGVSNPASRLSVSGGATIGSGYATSAAPTDGLAVEGKLLLGSSTSYIANSGTVNPNLQVHGLGVGNSSFMFTNWANDNTKYPMVYFGKSSGDAIGTHAVVASGETTGVIQFTYSDGTGFKPGSVITGKVDGAASAGSTPGALYLSTNSGSSLLDRLVIRASGSVGIGTASPSSLVDIYGGELTVRKVNATTSVVIDPDMDVSSLNPGTTNRAAQIIGPANQHLVLDLRNNDAQDSLALRYSAANTATVDTIGFVMKGNGNVGIGTTSPSSRLHVYGPSPALRVQSNASNDGIIAIRNVTNADVFSMSTDTSGTSSLSSLGYMNLNASGATSQMIFKTGGGTERMRITNTGTVGIGITSPQATLDVNGYARLKTNASAPATCSATNAGALAMTSKFTLCACDGTNWVSTNDGTAACVWN